MITVKAKNGEKKLPGFERKSIAHLMKFLKVNPETAIIKKNGKIAHEDDLLKNGDSVEFVGIIYGG
jgi:sulfur carrier protein ThiS